MFLLPDVPVDAALAMAAGVAIVSFGLINRRSGLSRGARREGAVIETLRLLLAIRTTLADSSPARLSVAPPLPAEPETAAACTRIGSWSGDMTGDQLLRLHASLRPGNPASAAPEKAPVPCSVSVSAAEKTAG